MGTDGVSLLTLTLLALHRDIATVQDCCRGF